MKMEVKAGSGCVKQCKRVKSGSADIHHTDRTFTYSFRKLHPLLDQPKPREIQRHAACQWCCYMAPIHAHDGEPGVSQSGQILGPGDFKKWDPTLM